MVCVFMKAGLSPLYLLLVPHNSRIAPHYSFAGTPRVRSSFQAQCEFIYHRGKTAETCFANKSQSRYFRRRAQQMSNNGTTVRLNSFGGAPRLERQPAPANQPLEVIAGWLVLGPE